MSLLNAALTMKESLERGRALSPLSLFQLEGYFYIVVHFGVGENWGLSGHTHFSAWACGDWLCMYCIYYVVLL